MLFNLTPELVLEEYSHEVQNNIKRAIEHILRSVWDSKHLVISDIETILKLKTIITCSDSLNVLIYLENNYSFLNYDSIKYSVNIVVGDNINNKTVIGDKTYLNLSINYFQNSNITNSTRILCEDISDAIFFEKICDYYINKNNLGNLSINYEAEHGGGNQINRIFKKHLLTENIFCLAFADNDKRYPTCPIGETLNKLETLDYESFLCSYISLDCQEIENLIPFNYIRNIEKVEHETNGIIFLENILDSSKKEHLKYYDLKKVIIKNQIISSNDFLNFAKELEVFSPVNIDFTNLNSYEKKHKIIPQIGKIIPAFLENPDLLNNIEPDFLNYQEIEWNKIGSAFLFWTCSRNNEPLNT